jgi:hypothetical protein
MRFILLIGALWWVLFGVPQAHAGYAQLSPPAGWTAAASATERATYRAAANEAWLTATVRTSAALSVGGEAVTMPAALRLAANAGRFAGGFAFGNPYLLLAVVGGSIIFDWYAQNGFQWDSTGQKWTKANSGPGICTVGPCYAYTMSSGDGVYYNTIDSACNAGANTQTNAPGAINNFTYIAYDPTVNANYPYGRCQLKRALKSDPNTWSYIYFVILRQARNPDPATYIPATQSDMENGMDGKPMPDAVAQKFPAPLPVEDPILNPSPALAPQPLRVPVGQPVPVPNTSPQQYKQPVVDAVPAPVPNTNPWRVDLQPKDVTSADPSGVTVPTTPPTTDPSGTTSTPNTNPDLCAQHPDASACATLGMPPTQEAIPTKTIPMSMDPDSGWNIASATCPAPHVVTLSGKSYEFSLQPMCDFASGIRPLVVAMAYVSAIFVFFGIARKSQS